MEPVERKRIAGCVLAAALLAALLLLGAGCSTVRPETPARNQWAKGFHAPQGDWCGVYMYRQGGGFRRWHCWIDGQYLGRLPGGTFFCRMVRPGRHTARWQVGNTVQTTDFIAKPGENAYIMASLESGKGMVVYSLDRVYPEEAEPAIRKLRMVLPQEDKRKDLKTAPQGEGRGSFPADW